jgi:hypothetical protein
MDTIQKGTEYLYIQHRRRSKVSVHSIKADHNDSLHNEGHRLGLAMQHLRGLLRWANAGMSLEVFPQCEALVAHQALEWSLPSVCASVSVQALLL